MLIRLVRITASEAWMVALIGVLTSFAFAAEGDTRGLGVRGPEGEEVGWYENSHALVIGVSDYTAGWSDLTSVPSEVESVAAVLEEHGFTVEKHLDLDAKALRNRFEDFVNKFGFGADNRLLVFFAGHGYTRSNGEKGYVVPADAPDPLVDDIAFARKALTMEQILTWARQIESKHAMFIFDSCFSGSLFKVRGDFELPRHISELTAQPVRQFITAGSADETVPALADPKRRGRVRKGGLTSKAPGLSILPRPCSTSCKLFGRMSPSGLSWSNLSFCRRARPALAR